MDLTYILPSVPLSLRQFFLCQLIEAYDFSYLLCQTEKLLPYSVKIRYSNSNNPVTERKGISSHTVVPKNELYNSIIN